MNDLKPCASFALFAATSLCATAALANPTYITADAMVDVKAGVSIAKPAIIVEDGKITAVGVQQSLPAPEGATKINLAGKTLLPGLIDMHVHLTGTPTMSGYRSLGVSAPRRLLTGVKNAETTLYAGFTTARNVGADAYNDVALRDAINDGDIVGPRLYVSGPPVGITGGHCSDNNLLPAEFSYKGEGVADGPWAMRAKVRQNIKYGVDLIKTCSTGGVFSKGTSLGAAQSTLEELKAIVDEAHARGLKVAAHAHGTVGIKNAIRAGVDTVEHASFLDDETINMAKRRGVYLAMDIYNTEYTLAEGEKNGALEESLQKERQVGTVQRASFTKAVRAGAKVLFGSDAAVYPHGDNGKQFARMVKFGMSPAQAIQAATSLAAEALDQSGALGEISVGAHADIIAVDGNPLENIETLENVAFVMKGGEVYKN